MGTATIVSPMVFPSNLHDDLWDMARSLAKTHGLEFSQPAAALMFAFLKQGTDNLREQNPQTIDHDLIFQASDNMIRFVKEMILVTLEEGSPELRSDLFERIKIKLCPLFPFC